MFHGKKKALTFSYDDAVVQDRRLVEIFNKYGLKGTFNLNSERFGEEGYLICEGVRVDHTRIRAEEVRDLYAGHEVAVHTLTHPVLTQIKDDTEIIRQVEQDRRNLSELVGYEVVGMAYPCGNVDDRVVSLLQNHTGVRYSRVVATTHGFEPFDDLLRYQCTLYHHPSWDMLFTLGQRFLELETDTPAVFSIWGHAYEFDIQPERWEEFEKFCNMMSGRDDIFYGTNREILLGE